MLIPQAEPLLHDEPLIEKHLRQALSNDYAQPVTGNFPTHHARALLWRQHEAGIQEALALAERHISQAEDEFSLSDPFLFLADLAHARPQHRSKVTQLMNDASKRLPKESGFTAISRPGSSITPRLKQSAHGTQNWASPASSIKPGAAIPPSRVFKD